MIFRDRGIPAEFTEIANCLMKRKTKIETENNGNHIKYTILYKKS